MDGCLSERGPTTGNENEAGLALVERGKSERSINWRELKHYVDSGRYAILGPVARRNLVP